MIFLQTNMEGEIISITFAIEQCEGGVELIKYLLIENICDDKKYT